MKKTMFIILALTLLFSLVGGVSFAQSYYDVSLKRGLNLISFPIAPTDSNIQAILSPISNYATDVKEFDAADAVNPWNRYHKGLDQYNDLTAMVEAKGYWINVKYDRILRVRGTAPTGDYVLDLKAGWNTLGWPYADSRDIIQTFPMLVFGTDYMQVSRFNPTTKAQENFSNNPATNDFTEFESGYGYYIYMTADKTVTLTLSINIAPMVDAGGDQTITLPSATNLLATITDDGLPSGTLNILWSKDSGPGDVTFSDETLAETNATFLTFGIYVLKVTADDGVLSNEDTITIIVEPQNFAPSVDAGGDQTITLPNPADLSATITDDGFPDGTLNILWSKDSGPGDVTFTDETQTVTSTTFSIDGTYVLKVTADDGALSSEDTITITVDPQSQEVTIIYTYDDLNRLEQVDHAIKTIRYDYDEVGNIDHKSIY